MIQFKQQVLTGPRNVPDAVVLDSEIFLGNTTFSLDTLNLPVAVLGEGFLGLLLFGEWKETLEEYTLNTFLRQP